MLGALALFAAALAATEAAWTGELLGRPLEVETVVARTPEEAARERIVFLNLGCRGDALRARPGATTFHIEASESMYGRAGEGAVLWHGALSRFGAEQLNERFESRFSRRATGAAWAGWMALKVISEAALRTRAAGADSLAAHLVSTAADFDGHKGRSLRFGAADHQLSQPLYLREGGGAPRSVEADPEPAHDAAWAALTSRPTPPGRYLLVSNEGSGDVLVIDLATHRAVSRIPVGSRPRGIHAAADGRHAYVALSDDAPDEASEQDAIAVLDLRTGRVVKKHDAGSDPEQFALSADGRTLYSANEDAGTATVTDLTSGRVLATLVVGIEPEGVAASPDGRWVYVTAETSNTVSVIDTRKHAVVASFLVGARPRAAAFSPDGRFAYVTNEIGGSLSVVEVARHAVVAEIALDEGGDAKPVGVAVSSDGASSTPRTASRTTSR